jgi:hypothetical protein
MEWPVEDEGESEGHPVMGWIGVDRKEHDPLRKQADFPLVFAREKV